MFNCRNKIKITTGLYFHFDTHILIHTFCCRSFGHFRSPHFTKLCGSLISNTFDKNLWNNESFMDCGIYHFTLNSQSEQVDFIIIYWNWHWNVFQLKFFLFFSAHQYYARDNVFSLYCWTLSPHILNEQQPKLPFFNLSACRNCPKTLEGPNFCGSG